MSQWMKYSSLQWWRLVFASVNPICWSHCHHFCCNRLDPHPLSCLLGPPCVPSLPPGHCHRHDGEDSKEPGADSFLQITRNIDDDNAQAAEMARMEDQADKIMGEDQGDYDKSDDSEDSKEPGTDSFLQIKRNIDDDNAQAAEMARMEDQAD